MQMSVRCLLDLSLVNVIVLLAITVASPALGDVRKLEKVTNQQVTVVTMNNGGPSDGSEINNPVKVEIKGRQDGVPYVKKDGGTHAVIHLGGKNPPSNSRTINSSPSRNKGSSTSVTRFSVFIFVFGQVFLFYMSLW